MTIQRPNFPQFFITQAAPCPYLPGQKERKIFTHLIGHDARAMSTQLIHSGFRRSQNIAYRPACDSCNACTSIRIPVESFEWTRGFRKVMSRNSDLVASIVKPEATGEHYDLFRSYIDTRHSDGGMADMSILDFAAMIDETVVDSRLIEFRFPRSHAEGGQLAAVLLIDVLLDGLSLVYSFYDPGHAARSLGTFMILDSLARARKLKLPFLYLGYFVEGSKKMEYKARFKPQERLGPGGWELER